MFIHCDDFLLVKFIEIKLMYVVYLHSVTFCLNIKVHMTIIPIQLYKYTLHSNVMLMVKMINKWHTKHIKYTYK